MLVIGGSYPGALSAWFRNRYPHLAVGSWSSSGVVQPILDIWQMDNQTYLSALKSGQNCVDKIQESMKYVTSQGESRDQGDEDNIITKTLVGSGVEGMRTDDWMFYYADIFLESVQYGNRTKMCDLLDSMFEVDNDKIVEAMTDFGTNVANVNPGDYDTRIIADTTIDVMASGRPWTFQYCSEYGFFQTPSTEEGHIMRSSMLTHDYWTKMCARSFGEGMVSKPQWEETLIDQGGFDIGVENVFYANGAEDPWKWAAVMTSNESLNQVARVSDCDNCGHCVELYTPNDAEDAPELKETRTMIADWVDALLTKKPAAEFLQ